MPSVRLNTYHDESGLVTVTVFRQIAPREEQIFYDLEAEVAEDMIAIGGGGEAVELPNGALLTASYPNDILSAWRVSSKSHLVDEYHRLQAYAIGLKIAGIPREKLLDMIFINWEESGQAEIPQATATIPAAFKLVSGGFKIDWSRPGNLATASFPSNDLAWTAKSKSHLSHSQANLYVCAIGLRTILPFGNVGSIIDYKDSDNAPHPSSVAALKAGYALTGGGAEVHWQGGVGNLLWKLRPVTDTRSKQFAAASKDHIAHDSCTITAYALGIKIRPNSTREAE
jgi:hypothetical protein